MSSLYERQFINKQDKMLISKSQGMFEQSNYRILRKCLKPFIEHGKFLLENLKSIFVRSKSSFGNSQSWKQ